MSAFSDGETVKYAGAGAIPVGAPGLLVEGGAALNVNGAPLVNGASWVSKNATEVASPTAVDYTVGLQPASAQAYFVWLGVTNFAATPLRIRCYVITGGTGAQTGEMGLYSTPLPPQYGTGQTLTKLVATGALQALTITGVIGNNANFATQVPAGTNLWAAIRVAMAANQPFFASLVGTMALGDVLTVNTGALTGTNSVAGTLLATQITPCPLLAVTLT